MGFYVKESYDIDFRNFVNEFDNFSRELGKFNVGLFESDSSHYKLCLLLVYNDCLPIVC